MTNDIAAQLQAHRLVMEEVERALSPAIASAASLLAEVLQKGGRLLVCGNGGSAADAQHFAAELVGRYQMERRGLAAIALSTDSSILTAVGNDYGFNTVFSRQVEALAVPGDALFGISTSGSSENVREAVACAARSGCRTVALLGGDGGSIAKIAELPIVVPFRDTPRVQEAHITIIHIICSLLEKTLFPDQVRP